MITKEAIEEVPSMAGVCEAVGGTTVAEPAQSTSPGEAHLQSRWPELERLNITTNHALTPMINGDAPAVPGQQPYVVESWLRPCETITSEPLQPENNKKISDAGAGSSLLKDVEHKHPMTARESEVHLTFDVDDGDYGSFITDLRTVLANHPDHQSDIKAYGDWLKVHPLLPKQVPFEPARWIYIKLLARDDVKKKHTTTLAVRGDNVYIIAFQNKELKWYEFCKKQTSKQKQKGNKKNIPTDEHLIQGSAFLGYESVYGALVGTPVWQKLDNLGKSSIRNAVFHLSAHGTAEQKGGQGIKKCLAKLIAILCESARMFPHMETVKNGWDASSGIILTEQLDKYMHSWEKMSRAMVESGENPPCKVSIGITNRVKACNIVHLILRSGKFKKAGDDDPAKNKSACPDHDKTRKGDPPPGNNTPPKEDGNDNSLKQENGNDKENGENHEGKNHNGEGQQQRKQHSLCLLEVFALSHSSCTASSPFVGRIAIFDGRRGQIIYWNEQNEDAAPKDNEYEGKLLLTGPYRAISAGGMVALKITAAKVSPVTLPIWDPYCEPSEHPYDKVLHKNIPGDLELTYAVLSSAVEATVKVDVFLSGDTSVTASVYGEISARSELASMVLFRCGIEDGLELIPSYAGSTVEFTRSVVAWSVGQRLVINVEKLRLTVDGNATCFKEPLFTFEDHTDRVCFTTLEGIGYARVSVDDSGVYREETKNWLPRSLRYKMNTDISVETELLIFTFEENNLLPCLLQLTNKSGDRRVAFRCCPGQESAAYFNEISEISVILPPDSTSTYLVKLKSQLPPERDALSLILESCVALKEDDDDVEEEEEDVDKIFSKQTREEEDVDKIFSKQTRAGIEKVTLKTTGAADKTTTGAADKTMICEIIPHNLNQKEPLIHRPPESSHLHVAAAGWREDRPEINSIPSESEITDGHTGQVRTHRFSGMEYANILLQRILDGAEDPTHLSPQMLMEITGNFSEDRKIGQGGFGTVYKGILGERIVAVKRIYIGENSIDDKHFCREFVSLYNTSHRNVVRGLGFCSNKYKKMIEDVSSGEFRLVTVLERLLCFEYISNGSLDKHITDELRGFEWETRYEIIIGICKGLRYLHMEKDIIHMDLKPSNILLDSQDGKYLVPKITDFFPLGQIKNSHTKGQHYRSRGYFAPEYENDGKISCKSDIYSLGAIIMELVTGCRDVPNKNNVLRRWRHRWNKPPTQLQYRQVTRCIDIATHCREQKPEARPSILEIISFLSQSESTYSPIISCFDEDNMLKIKPLELLLPSGINREISCSIELTNDTLSCIAFNIQLPSARYSAQPVKGIVQPGYTYNVKIIVQALDLYEHHQADKLIVQSKTVSNYVRDEDITERTFNLEAGKVFDEVNLMVAYVSTKPGENRKRRKDTNTPAEEVQKMKQRKIAESASRKGKNKLSIDDPMSIVNLL